MSEEVQEEFVFPEQTPVEEPDVMEPFATMEEAIAASPFDAPEESGEIEVEQ